MKILIVDNYDSFTYNLSHYAKSVATEVEVVRNDALIFEDLERFDKIIISPGPGLPKETKNLFEVLSHFHSKKPILGVCLGMQGIAEFFGGTLLNQEKVKHGVEEVITIKESSLLFETIPAKIKVGLYHSWKVDTKSFPQELKITAVSENGVIMALEHKAFPVFGVQFHPESIMTEYGKIIISNFIGL